MPTDVIIEPSSGQIYWNDSGAIGASQSISIAGNAQDQIRILGYGFIYTLGGNIGASTERVVFNDSLTSTIRPGANGSGLGDATYSWDLYANNSYFRQPALFQSTSNSTSLFSGSIQSNGGIGISGNASIGQSLNIFNSTDGRYFVGFRAASGLAATNLYTLPTGYPGTGTSVLQSDTSGNLSWTSVLTAGGSVGSATTARNIDVATTNTASTLYPVMSGAATTVTGTGVSSNTSLTFVPSTGVFSSPFFYASYSVGSEGGEIVFNKPASGSGLTTTITMDIQGDKFRIFETGGANRGFFLDFSTDSAAGVGKNIIGTASIATTSNNVNVSGAATSNFEHRIIFTTASTSVAGAALSQNATLSYNPSTDIFSSSGILVTSGTSATNTTSGAFQVRGGIGATGTSYFQTISVASLTGTGNAVINGNFEFKGVGTFGDNAQLDTINFNARFSDTVAPSANNTYDLGAVGLGATGPLMWKNIYAATGVSAPTITATNLSGTLTGNVTGTATTSQNTTVVFSSTPATNHPLAFTPQTSSVAGAAISAVSTIFATPSTGTLNATTFSGAFSGTLSGYASTGRNVDVQLATTNATHAVTFTPQLTAVVGSATSSDNTLVYNPATKILTTSGLAVTATTETTSSTTGALLVTGSAGIARSLSVGTSVIFWNGANYSAFKSGATANQTYTLPVGYPGTGVSVLASDTSGTMTWVPSSGGGGGSGTVNAGAANKVAYYPSAASTVDDATGMTYAEFSSGTAVTFQIFGGAATGNTIFTVSGIGQTLVRVGIGVSNPQFELEINGEISATNKSFVIDHPTKPGMKLRYGSLEGPENGVYVRGELKDTNIIIVPDHWYGLVDVETYSVHLTPIGTYAQLFVEKIEDYNVKIGDSRGLPIHCYYSVWAERKDIPKLVTEY